MCGRYGFTNPQQLEDSGLLGTIRPDAVSDAVVPWLTPRFNIAPSQPVVAARTRVRDGAPGRRLDVLQWGLIPSWARDPKIGNALANARAETLSEKPAFRGAWKAGRRCLIPADVFYEWRDVGDATADPRNGDPGTTGRRRVARAPKPAKQPYAIRLQENAPFCFGGLWEVWRDRTAGEGTGGEDGDAEHAAWVPTCTIITTAPNALMRRLHDRMPVIVPPEAYDRWLDPETPIDEARALLAPYAPEAMRAFEVTRYVNDPRNDDPHVLDPLGLT